MLALESFIDVDADDDVDLLCNQPVLGPSSFIFVSFLLSLSLLALLDNKHVLIIALLITLLLLKLPVAVAARDDKVGIIILVFMLVVNTNALINNPLLMMLMVRCSAIERMKNDVSFIIIV